MYRDLRYAVDLRHPLQPPCGGADSSNGHDKTHIQSSRPWECGNPEGISKECGKGGKPASWLSILCHFHGLFAEGNGRLLDVPSLSEMSSTRHQMDSQEP